MEVVIPTLKGRETACERVVEAYKAQDAKVLVVKGAPTCGEGWAAGLAKATADVVLLGTDDMEPHSGTVEAGLKAVERNVYPSPRLLLDDGSLESCGSLGGGGCHLRECPTGTPANMSSLPIATKETWEKIGPPLAIHYYVDDYLGYLARSLGLSCEVERDYLFTHHDEQYGRRRVITRWAQDRASFLEMASQRMNLR